MLEFSLPIELPVALTIAGSDPSGGAGLQADLKTFHQFGVYGMAIPTLVTVQNTRSVEAVVPLDAGLVRNQLDCVQRDIPPSAAKIGAIPDTIVVEAIAEWASDFDAPLVVDPVIKSTHGQTLTSHDAVTAMIEVLLPSCLLVTPNLHEASLMSGVAVHDPSTMRDAAERIAACGVRHVLVKGGHLEGPAVDLLWSDGDALEFSSARIHSRHTHGTGCTYSAAITALLAQSVALVDAVVAAKRFVTEAIRTAPGLGQGSGPVNHHAPTGLGQG